MHHLLIKMALAFTLQEFMPSLEKPFKRFPLRACNVSLERHIKSSFPFIKWLQLSIEESGEMLEPQRVTYRPT